MKTDLIALKIWFHAVEACWNSILQSSFIVKMWPRFWWIELFKSIFLSIERKKWDLQKYFLLESVNVFPSSVFQFVQTYTNVFHSILFLFLHKVFVFLLKRALSTFISHSWRMLKMISKMLIQTQQVFGWRGLFFFVRLTISSIFYGNFFHILKV